mmetsp:Transcript_5204/g.15469  ORF Transcript_5204/g.15469 Transcript_5204/m.15469 type:complete len:89 (-) Transcript_5204:88-354(-)
MRTGTAMDLAARLFGISAGAASEICQTWWVYMHMEVERESAWPTRAEVDHRMPPAFAKMGGGKMRVVIDCTEIIIEAPNDPLLRKAYW